MAKKRDFSFLEEATKGADLKSENKPSTKELEEKAKEEKKKRLEAKKKKEKTFKVKTLSIPIEWDEKIREHINSPTSGYMVTAIRNQMVRDGII